MNIYTLRTCKCGRQVSANGAAWHSHMMAHVRRGEAAATQPYLDIYGFTDYRRCQYVFVWLEEPKKKE